MGKSMFSIDSKLLSGGACWFMKKEVSRSGLGLHVVRDEDGLFLNSHLIEFALAPIAAEADIFLLPGAAW